MGNTSSFSWEERIKEINFGKRWFGKYPHVQPRRTLYVKAFWIVSRNSLAINASFTAHGNKCQLACRLTSILHQLQYSSGLQKQLDYLEGEIQWPAANMIRDCAGSSGNHGSLLFPLVTCQHLPKSLLLSWLALFISILFLASFPPSLPSSDFASNFFPDFK